MSAKQKEEELKATIAELRATLRAKEAELADLQRKKQVVQEYGLNNDEILRYSRQIFLQQISVQGMLLLYFLRRM